MNKNYSRISWENEVNDVSVLLGSIISRREMLEQSQNAAKILFPTCWLAELVISNRHQPSVNCPLEVLIREIRNSTDQEINVKEVTTNFITQLTSVSKSQNQPNFDLTNNNQHMISFELNKDNEYGEYVAHFVLSSTLNRIIRLEQFNEFSSTSTLLKQRYPCCSQGTEASTWISREDNMLILKLCESLWDTEANRLQHKVLRYVMERTNSENGFIVMRNIDTSELVCHCTGNEIFEESTYIENDSFFNEIMQSGKTFKATHLNSNADIQIHSVLCSPVFTRSCDSPIAVVCLINKRDSQFTQSDERIIEECFRFVAPILLSSLAYQNERYIRVELFLFILRIRCSVFLLDSETNVLVAKVLDGLPTAPNKNTRFTTADGKIVTLPEEIRLSLNQGIAGYVATTGELLNIKDAYAHPLFYRGVDKETGFRTRNILCFPIKNEKDGIVGVAQLCNKINHPFFTRADEDSLMYKNVQDAQHRTKLANELMMYHMKVDEDKKNWLTTCEIKDINTFLPNASSFESLPRNIQPENETYLCTLSMFHSLNLINRWRISRRTLAQFILMVRRGYRNPAYHNWMHAFSVAHFVYVCIKNLPLANNQLDDIEILALFVASLCHDIDHRGTNNSFQVQSKSVLAALYSSEGSVLERHHFSQTICVLNTEGCNIFENVSKEDYGQLLDHIRDIIVATDLSHHLRIMPKLEELSHRGYDGTKSEDHYLLSCLLMTSADLSDQTKSWNNTVYVAKLIYEEFFQQGDMEKSLGHNPIDSMDRERACVPNLQISFLDYIITPLYKVLNNLYPQCSSILDTIEKNRDNWKIILELVEKGYIKVYTISNIDVIINMREQPPSLDSVVGKGNVKMSEKSYGSSYSSYIIKYQCT
ncbi:putative cgmp-dependent 3,5-cyclic phosphodiesterase [Schistosoma mansoni]|uniref:putative cgmp-dependent 3,5-cyclic phosphodiesterase n=1 Tax=Schistosoma mansoni TaxID=6183 RepID=UPI00022DBE88|nr:putative cgmp-dependent 3,5-cyclic phosphodiesterase [Schistosoma mansoni]|eukprot:XP_018651910.1 putative cgmp-dependent 3,5-cyclic phosphodiesterase [Schistosoma mansoni]